MAQSPYATQTTEVPLLPKNCGLATDDAGRVPYQKWRVSPWDEDMRYVWMVGDHDFRRSDNVEMILYFHGMHSKDYYTAFRKELKLLVEQRPDRPFLFIGFVDTPFVLPDENSSNRWKALAPPHTQRPERLLKTVNRLFMALRKTFPNLRKDRTTIALAGFSGGGRVLDAVGTWLANSPQDDPYAEVFRSHLSKMAYFDCWFDKEVVKTVQALLESKPDMKIVGTVHMKKPVEHAAILAGKYKMKPNRKNRELVGLGGRLVIYRDDSHWEAMISRLREAL